MSILGYADRLSVSTGDEIHFLVSAEPVPYSASLLRLHGVEDGPAGLAVREEVLDSTVNGIHQGRRQPLDAGSRVEVVLDRSEVDRSIGAACWVCPTAVDGDSQIVLQVLAAGSDGGKLVLLIDRAQVKLRLAMDDGVVCELVHPRTLVAGEWVLVSGGYDGDARTVSLACHARGVEVDFERATVTCAVQRRWSIRMGRVSIGADYGGGRNLNGRLAAPVLLGRPPGAVEVRDFLAGDRGERLAEAIAVWDFSVEMADRRAVDVGPYKYDGVLVNAPTQAVLGPFWDRRTLRWTDAPEQWNAVHVHDDDLDDARWRTDFTLVAPNVSGAYALRVEQQTDVFYIPFYVRPGRTHADVLFLAPTNTYLAYGNEHLWEGERGEAHAKLMSGPIELDRAERRLAEFPDLGRSLYDTHSDGSGVMYTSRRRPLTNIQPNYRNWLVQGRRHYSADFFLFGWLERLGIPFDVATDEDLDRDGVELLAHYNVVVTGSHPEYVTEAELDALEAYLAGGGKVMYMGANGFFWVTSYTDDAREGIEVRRGCAAQRNWTSHPAEIFHSSTGECGAAWRHRGRDQNPVFGIGMAAAGWGRASGYERTPESFAEDVAWVFEGITESRVGEDGEVLGGAAGDELDHADPARGTPEHARILLSSRQSSMYQPSVDSLNEIGPGLDGSVNDRVRADVVLLDQRDGGSVFSTGSICWAGAMGYNGYDNPVARLSSNVLRRFLKDAGPKDDEAYKAKQETFSGSDATPASRVGGPGTSPTESQQLISRKEYK